MLLCSLALVGLACLLASPLSRPLGGNAGWVLSLPLLGAAALLILAFTGSDGVPVQHLDWIPSLGVGLDLRLDGLAMLFSMLVLLIGAGVMCYSPGYLGRARQDSFYVWMTLFAASMLLLVLADDLVVMFVAWEGTTLCSFFLISRSGPAARQPAVRTLLVTVLGGLALLSAVCVMIAGTGTSSLSRVLDSPVWREDPAFTVTVAVLLAVAAFTKSAQFPFQSWLPDSMVAITPVSTYLHAATMVKAGIYVLLRFSPVLAGVPVWSVLLITAGLITALLGAFSAVRRYDLKELLAYSTMSQLGLLVAMVGVGTPEALTAATVHTAAHALFKSSLFMVVGVVDHQAGTRDMRRLAVMDVRMPVLRVIAVLAAASMAGIPLLFGFISKEEMFTAYIEYPHLAAVVVLGTAGLALTSVFTFAYSARLVLGAFTRDGAAFAEHSRGGAFRPEDDDAARPVREASPLFWAVPGLAAAAGLVLGIRPGLLDGLFTEASASVAGHAEEVHLHLWHGINAPLLVSSLVIATGLVLVWKRRALEPILQPLASPVSGLAAVEGLRTGIIRCGEWVSQATATNAPRRHLLPPVLFLVVIAVAGLFGLDGLDQLPATVGDRSRPWDWALLVLLGAGVAATVVARTRIAAVVVTGVVGFSMMLWFFVLGAADVAITQLLVEILTVVVMVLLLHRLPKRFARERGRDALAPVVAVLAGLAAFFGVWALTGRREHSAAAEYFLTRGEEQTGALNLVAAILVDFRALDTLGELTVLGVAGLAMMALLKARPPVRVRRASYRERTPLVDAEANGVLLRVAAHLLLPVIVLLSVYLLLRGHYEPGGGFIAALVGGAGFALLYLAAPSDAAAKIRWPYQLLIGSGILLGTVTGLVGFLKGSFLTPIKFEVFGLKLSTPLIFDLGVYFGVLGVILVALNKLGRADEHGQASPDEIQDSDPPADAAEDGFDDAHPAETRGEPVGAARGAAGPGGSTSEGIGGAGGVENQESTEEGGSR
ncbi:DUF4040 family protein [Rothia kristinae]